MDCVQLEETQDGQGRTYQGQGLEGPALECVSISWRCCRALNGWKIEVKVHVPPSPLSLPKTVSKFMDVNLTDGILCRFYCLLDCELVECRLSGLERMQPLASTYQLFCE